MTVVDPPPQAIPAPPSPPGLPMAAAPAPMPAASGGTQYCQTDMDSLKAEAYAGSVGYAPDGRCYSHVADFIDATGYGGIQKGGFNDAIPSDYWAEAHDFADYLN